MGQHHPLVFPHVQHPNPHVSVHFVLGLVVVPADEHGLLQSCRQFVLQPCLEVGPRAVGRAVEQVPQQHQLLGLALSNQGRQGGERLEVDGGRNCKSLGTKVFCLGQMQVTHNQHRFGRPPHPLLREQPHVVALKTPCDRSGRLKRGQWFGEWSFKSRTKTRPLAPWRHSLA